MTTVADIVTVPLTLVPDSPQTNRLDVTLLHTGTGSGSDTDTTIASGSVTIELDLDLTDPLAVVPTGFHFVEQTPGLVNLTALSWQWSYLIFLKVKVTSTGMVATGRTEGPDMEPLVTTGVPGAYTFLTDSNPVVLNRGIVTSDSPLGVNQEADLMISPLVAYTTNRTGNVYMSTNGIRSGLFVTYDIAVDMPVNFIAGLGTDNTLSGVGTIAATGTVVVILSDYDGDNLADFEDPDDDNDLLPDEYENLYAELDPQNETDALLDLDEDGMTTLDEYIAGTSPADPDDYLSLNWNGTELVVDSVSGRLYTLFSRAHLTTGTWSVVENEVTGAGTPLTFPVSAVESVVYYRVNVKLDD